MISDKLIKYREFWKQKLKINVIFKTIMIQMIQFSIFFIHVIYFFSLKVLKRNFKYWIENFQLFLLSCTSGMRLKNYPTNMSSPAWSSLIFLWTSHPWKLDELHRTGLSFASACVPSPDHLPFIPSCHSVFPTRYPPQPVYGWCSTSLALSPSYNFLPFH